MLARLPCPRMLDSEVTAACIVACARSFGAAYFGMIAIHYSRGQHPITMQAPALKTKQLDFCAIHESKGLLHQIFIDASSRDDEMGLPSVQPSAAAPGKLFELLQALGIRLRNPCTVNNHITRRVCLSLCLVQHGRMYCSARRVINIGRWTNGHEQNGVWTMTSP